jgi:hypothetical protein
LIELPTVLNRKESTVTQKGKEAEIQEWEAEVLQSQDEAALLSSYRWHWYRRGNCSRFLYPQRCLIAGMTIASSNEQRENSAHAIGELVPHTEESSHKPFVIPFIGPLIRVATQRQTTLLE